MKAMFSCDFCECKEHTPFLSSFHDLGIWMRRNGWVILQRKDGTYNFCSGECYQKWLDEETKGEEP